MANLCKLSKKGLDKDFKAYVALIDDPKYVCEKCGRASNKKGSVCKPKSIVE